MKIKEKVLKGVKPSYTKSEFGLIIDLTLAEVGKVIDEAQLKDGEGCECVGCLVARELKQKLGLEVLK